MSVLCVGQIVADIVVRPAGTLPDAGTTDAVDEIRFVAGGCAANTASVLAKLGLPVHFVGQVGCDAFGDMVAGDLVDSGVNVAGLIRDAITPTASVIVLVAPDGERSFLYREGGNERLTTSAVNLGRFAGDRILHVGGAMKLYSLDLARLLEAAKSLGMITVLDTDWEPKNRWRERLDPALGLIDYILTNEKEGQMITGENSPESIARSMLRHGPLGVAVKLGARGSLLALRGRMAQFEAFDVPVVDTTCAGDSFAAAFVYGLHAGWEWEQTMRFANAAGALSTTSASHQAIRSIDDVYCLLGSTGLAQAI